MLKALLLINSNGVVKVDMVEAALANIMLKYDMIFMDNHMLIMVTSSSKYSILCCYF